jgi:hypothetical protein
MDNKPEKSDDEIMLDQCAKECMEAIDSKDKDKFVESLHVLIADLLNKMQTPEQGTEE